MRQHRTISPAIVPLLAAVCLAHTEARAGGFVVDGSIFRIDNGTPADFTDDFSSVDIIRFRALSPGNVIIDILSWEQDLGEGVSETSRSRRGGAGVGVDVNMNGRIAFFDTHIHLFRDTGAPLAAADWLGPAFSNDDSFSTFGDGSISFRDSFLSVFLEAGDYALAIGASNLTVEDAAMGFNSNTFSEGPVTVIGEDRLPNDVGDYRATIIGDVALSGAIIPLPNAAGLGALGMVILTGVSAFRRRRDTRTGA